MDNSPKPEPTVLASPRKHRVTPEPETNANSTPKHSKLFSFYKSVNYTTRIPSISWFTNEYVSTKTTKDPILKPSPEPSPEPKTEPTFPPSPEPEPSFAPNPEPEPEPEPEYFNWGEVSPEPGPDFSHARDVWGIAWPLHYFICGVLFAILFFMTVNSLAALLCGTQNTRFQRRRFFVAVNSLLCYMCLVMALHMFIDPYGSGEFIPNIPFRGVIYLLTTMKYPCLTTSFSLVQISILEAIKFKVYSTRLHSLRLIFVITLLHFSIVVIGGLVMLTIRHTLAISITCQVFLLCVGLVFSIMSIYSGLKICFYYSDSEVTLSKIKNDMKLTTDSVDSVITTHSNVAVTIGSFMKTNEHTVIPDILAQHNTQNVLDDKFGHINRQPVTQDTLAQLNEETIIQDTLIELNTIPDDIELNQTIPDDIDDLEWTSTSMEYDIGYDSPVATRKSRDQVQGKGMKKEKKISRISAIINIEKKDNSVHRIAILLVSTAVFALLLCACVIFQLLSSTKGDWWNWYIYQTITRLSEGGMVACMALIVQKKGACNVCSRITKVRLRRQSDGLY